MYAQTEAAPSRTGRVGGAPVGTRVKRSSELATRAPVLVVLCGFVGLVLVFGDAAGADPAERSTLAAGFLLLAATLAGGIARNVGLPRITGYIVLGLVVGPEVLGLVGESDIAGLRLIDDIAISLIALTAGGELKLAELRRRARSLAGITTAELTTVFLVIFCGTLLVSDLLPLTAGQDTTTLLVIAMIFGSIAVANSPSVAIAVINETRSRGPVSSTILGVTVIKDVAVILLFTVALALGRAALSDGGAGAGALFLTLAWEIGGSLAAGAFSGWLISRYLGGGRRSLVLFALMVAFLNAHVAALLHLEVLLLSLSAGFFLENISPVNGDRFIHALETNSLPIYALFFSLAGATIHLDALPVLWPFVLAFVLARAAAIWAGTAAGARLTGAEPEVQRYAWLGFVSQAGVTLGMVVITARVFPQWGAELQTLFITMVAVHELVGPVLLQFGLGRAGEVGARDMVEDAADGGLAPAGA